MINIIPLIDVLVVLLIFYIATTVFKKAQPIIVIKVPDSSQATSSKEDSYSIIYVTKDSKVFYDDKPVEIGKLGALLKEKKEGKTTYNVAMKADTDAPFGLITKVLDAAHVAGIPNLPTFTDDTSKKAGATGP